MPTGYHIEFEPVGRRGLCQEGKSILWCAQYLGVGINSICGGKGTCGACKVRIINGSVSRPTSREKEHLNPQEIENGWRLACETLPHSDCKISVPAKSMNTPQRMQTEGMEFKTKSDLPLKSYELHMAAPSLGSECQR